MLVALRHSWWWASRAHTKTKSPGHVIGGREGLTSSSWEYCLHLASGITLLNLLFCSLLLPSHLCEEFSYPDSPFPFPRAAVAQDYNPVAPNNENFFLTVLKDRSPTSRCQPGWLVLEALKKNPLHTRHLASGGRWHSFVCLGLGLQNFNLHFCGLRGHALQLFAVGMHFL